MIFSGSFPNARQSKDAMILYIWVGVCCFFFKVTEGKQDLERACQLARKMRKEAALLSEWLATTEAELVQKSTSESLLSDLDSEVAWAKVSMLYISVE